MDGGMKQMATVGLRDLFVAPVTETDGAEVYGTIKRLAKAIKAEMSVEVAEGLLYADDGVDDTVKEFVKGALKLNVNDLEPEDVAMLLGQHIDENKVIIAGETDDPPYFAVAFRAKKSKGGRYRYLWLYKVKFKIPNENFETKGDAITFVTPEIEGDFIKRDSDGNWKADFTGVPTDPVAVSWFTSVYENNSELDG
jgi:phi13 family phage major tail protein